MEDVVVNKEVRDQTNANIDLLHIRLHHRTQAATGQQRNEKKNTIPDLASSLIVCL